MTEGPSGTRCSLHQQEMYEDTHDGEPMGRLLCPEAGCTSVLSTATLAAVREQMWLSGNGIAAPGWQEIGG